MIGVVVDGNVLDLDLYLPQLALFHQNNLQLFQRHIQHFPSVLTTANNRNSQFMDTDPDLIATAQHVHFHDTLFQVLFSQPYFLLKTDCFDHKLNLKTLTLATGEIFLYEFLVFNVYGEVLCPESGA